MSSAVRQWPGVEECAPEIGAVLGRAARIVCLAHKDADADSLGSCLAFVHSLREMGREAVAVVPDPMPMLLSHLPGFELVQNSAPAQLDALFTFDCATVGRFGEKGALIDGAQYPVVNIDHHVSNEGFGTVNLIEPWAAATGQVVHRLLRALDMPIPPAAATNLYAALFTDTGGFRHENTNEAVLRLGADLVALGADPVYVALKSYKSRSEGQLRLEAMAVASMTSELEGRLLWTEITQEMLGNTGADMQESEGIIDQLQSVDTMQIAVAFKETSDGRIRISVRTRDQYDATDLCAPFGGGGHRRAAGADVSGPIAEVRERVLVVARNMLSGA
jgi:phosphoesterase RecJ-like protein